MPNPVEKRVTDLVTKISEISEFKGNVYPAYGLEFLEQSAAALPPPSVVVHYLGMSGSDPGKASGLNPYGMFGVIILGEKVCLDVRKRTYSIATLDLLYQIALKVGATSQPRSSTTSALGHKWEFVSEKPLLTSVDQTYVMYTQTWQTRIPLR